MINVGVNFSHGCTSNESLSPLNTLSRRIKVAFALTIAVGGIQFLITPVHAAATPIPMAIAKPAAAHTPKPTATRTIISTTCQKVLVEIANADKTYVALQFGVIKAAQSYLDSTVLTNILLYNDSIINVLKAADVEYSFATSSAKCFPATSITNYSKYLKSNLASITSIQNSNISGLAVGKPKLWLTYKPIGLLH